MLSLIKTWHIFYVKSETARGMPDLRLDEALPYDLLLRLKQLDPDRGLGFYL